MTREIPAVKARYQYIPYILEIVNRNKGNYHLMVKELHRFICSKSSRHKFPSIESAVNMTLPTLRLLRLAQGKEDDTRLSVKGEIMLRTSQNSGGEIVESKFRKTFAKHLLELEKRYYVPVIDIAQKLGKNVQGGLTFSETGLLEYIKTTFGGEVASSDRLRKWLSYLEFVGFIHMIGNGNIYQVHDHQIRAATAKDVKVPEGKFRRELMKKYERLSHDRESPYVPIPDLRESVLRSFDGRLWDEDFDDMLKKIKKEDNRYVINFAEPMYPKIDGFRLDGSYYYYIIIRDKEQE